MISLLLAYGAEVNAKDIRDRTPLHIAGLHGNYEAVSLLVSQRGININVSLCHNNLIFDCMELRIFSLIK